MAEKLRNGLGLLILTFDTHNNNIMLAIVNRDTYAMELLN